MRGKEPVCKTEQNFNGTKTKKPLVYMFEITTILIRKCEK